jgi:hypothetical protein
VLLFRFSPGMHFFFFLLLFLLLVSFVFIFRPIGMDCGGGSFRHIHFSIIIYQNDFLFFFLSINTLSFNPSTRSCSNHHCCRRRRTGRQHPPPCFLPNRQHHRREWRFYPTYCYCQKQRYDCSAKTTTTRPYYCCDDDCSRERSNPIESVAYYPDRSLSPRWVTSSCSPFRCYATRSVHPSSRSQSSAWP